MAIGGTCTKLRRHYGVPREEKFRPPRGEVRSFSRKSRTRLQQTLCAMPVRQVQAGMLFVTLTYPRDWPGSWAVWKRHLDTWQKRLMRRLPSAAFVWKLEPQARGAPHFHLVVVGVPFMARDWLSRTWYEVVGSQDERHLRAGTQVQQVRSHRGVKSYAAKYTAKAEQLPDSWQGGVGRWWGVYGRARLGIVWERTPLTQAQFWQCCRALYQLLGSRYRARGRAPPRRYSNGMWVVLSDAGAHRLADLVAPDSRPQTHEPCSRQTGGHRSPQTSA